MSLLYLRLIAQTDSFRELTFPTELAREPMKEHFVMIFSAIIRMSMMKIPDAMSPKEQLLLTII